MKYRALITNLLNKSEDKHTAIKELRMAGHYICSDIRDVYIECDTLECAELIDCLNFNI